MYNVKFLKGTSTQLEGITRDLNTFYYVDDKDLFLGNIKLSNGEELAAAILRIAAIENDYLKSTDKTALQGQIDLINKELGALTGTDSGKSISQMIKDAIDTLDRDLQGQIDTISGDVTTIKNDYLKGADKTELEGKITAEATTARAAEKANADAIAAVKKDVDAFFKDATISEAAKDTLKEIQEYIDSDVQGAAAMTESINGVKDRVKAIEDDYLKGADKTELQGNINTVSGKVTTLEGEVAKKAAQSDLKNVTERVSTLEDKVNVENVSEAITTAKGEATKYADDAIAALDATVNSADVEDGKGIKITVVETDGKLTSATVSGNYDNKYDTKGAAAQALTDAKTYTNDEIGKLKYDAQGSAAQALEDAKDYADGLAKNYDAAGSASTAETNAKAYADGLAGNYATAAQGTKADSALQKADITTGSANGTIAVKGADVAVKGLGSAAYTASTAYDAAGTAETKANAALASAKTYAENEADTAEANAKAYVDTALTWGTIA